MPAEVATVPLTGSHLFLVLGLVLIVMQFVFKVWEKRASSELIDAIQESNSAILQVISPNIEKTRSIYGMVKDLKGMHSVRDDDGRFMWYMPKEIIETQRELVQLTTVLATTQEHLAKLLEQQMAEMKSVAHEQKALCKECMAAIKEEIRLQG